MAVAARRVWKKAGLKSPEMAVFAVHLGLNFAWSAAFFGLHRIGATLIEIAALDLTVLLTLALFFFFRRDRPAGLLFLPYLACVLFATVLTHAFWTLNG
jgi:translocator protein